MFPPLLTLTKGRIKTGINFSFCNNHYNYIMAASMVLTLPALAIYAFFNRYFIQGVTFTGGKE
jgi:ABC-type glycerol-3-phosphate transport system permease component